MHGNYVFQLFTGRERGMYPASPGWPGETEAPWRPLEFPFTAQPGLINDAAVIQSDEPADFLGLLMTEELLQILVDQTNLYAVKSISRLPNLPHSRINKWKPVTVKEMKEFLGLYFLTGLVWKPELQLFWKKDTVHETPYFGKVMSRNRFQIILRFLHFSDAEDTGADRLYKIRPVLNYLQDRFQTMFQPGQDISIDEGTLLWRGRLGFTFCNPLKPIRYGIKSYILCDSATGYCHSISPYCGQYSSLSNTVHTLLGSLTGQGYHLYMDNYYNSVGLCNELLAKNTHVCGTLRLNRGAPVEIQQATKSNLSLGETIVQHQGKVMVLAWSDNKIVRMLSTFHHNTMGSVSVWRKSVGGRVTVKKPQCVLDYNNKMNGVDKLDQNLSYYPFARRSSKWTNKFVMYMFSIAIFNSFILYQARHPEGNIQAMLGFIEAIVAAWTNKTPPGPLPPDPRNARLSRHRPENIPATRVKKYPTRVCQVCRSDGKGRRETRHQCGICRVPMHKDFCFDRFHQRLAHPSAVCPD